MNQKATIFCSFKLQVYHEKSNLMGQTLDINNTMVPLACQKIYSHIGEIFCTDNPPYSSKYLRYSGLYAVIAHVDMSKPQGNNH